MKKWIVLLMIVAISVSGCWPFDKDKDETTTTVTNPGQDPGQMQIVDAQYSDNEEAITLSGSAKNIGQGECFDITLWVTISNLSGNVLWYENRAYPTCAGGQTITYNNTVYLGNAVISQGYAVYYEITYYYYTNRGSIRKVGK